MRAWKRLFSHNSFVPVRQFWKKAKYDFGKYSAVEPGIVSSRNSVPDFITKPSYYLTGNPTEALTIPEIKNKQQIESMKRSCRLAANILKKVGEKIQVGLTTDEIDKIVHDLAIKNNAYPSTLNYSNFPKSVCTSVNNVACHGIPDDRPLENGDIINVDITVYYNGYHGDCSKTYLVGDVDEKGIALVEATELCLNEAIRICKPGQYFRSIGALIQQKAEILGYNVVPCFAGHGIGSYFHGPPDIYHCANFYPGDMRTGMTFTIEPVLTQGGQEIEILEDNWTAVTVDQARTAQFEHTLLVTESGVEILTLPD